MSPDKQGAESPINRAEAGKTVRYSIGRSNLARRNKLLLAVYNLLMKNYLYDDVSVTSTNQEVISSFVIGAPESPQWAMCLKLTVKPPHLPQSTVTT